MIYRIKKKWLYGEGEKQSSVTIDVEGSQRIIRLDGVVRVDEMANHNLRVEYSFDVNGHHYCLVVSRGYLIWRRTYTLTVDGVLIPEQ